MSDKRSEMEDAATDAVQRSGLQNLSFRTLGEAVGVKSSSVHYYFPEKSDLAASLIKNYTEEFETRLAEIDKRKLSTKAKLDAFIKIFEDVIKAEKFCLCGMMAAEVATLDEDNRELLNQYFNKVEGWLCGVFKNGKSEISSSLSPLVLARLLMSGLEGAILIDRVEHTKIRIKAHRDFIRSLFK